MTEETKQKKEKTPWMFVSIFLGVLLIASMGFNFVITADVIANGGTVGGTGNTPPTGSNNPPTGGGIQPSGEQFYKQLAADLGLNTEQFNSCLATGKYRQEVQKDFVDGNTAEVTGTPTFFIGNDQIGYTKLVGAQPYSAFQPIIDQLLASPPTGGVVQVSADDDPVLGDPNAPITIIEFSDFQCPFCGRFYSQTEGLLIQDYVNTGKAKFVYRDFPLTSIHPRAQPAAEAAECADEQGKFWEFHDALFDNQALL